MLTNNVVKLNLHLSQRSFSLCNYKNFPMTRGIVKSTVHGAVPTNLLLSNHIARQCHCSAALVISQLMAANSSMSAKKREVVTGFTLTMYNL
jgi:hypothetical protein